MTATSVEDTATHKGTPVATAIDALTLEQAAFAAVEQGNLALAELAYLKLATAAPSADALANLFEVAAARNNYHLAQRTLETLIEIEPNNVQAFERLAEVRGATGDTAGAVEALRRALLIEPHNAALAAWHAIWSQGVLERFHEVPDLLLKAAELDEDGSQLEQIVDALIYHRRYADAEHFIGVFQEKTGSLHPTMLRLLGVALAGQDRIEEAREVFGVAIDSCDSVLDEKAPSDDLWRRMDEAEFHRVCELYAFRARLEHEAGRTLSALGTYAILRAGARARGLTYPDSLVPDAAERLADLRRIVGGRDLVLLCHGHSVKDFAARIGELGARNPVFASLNRFGVIEHEVLAPAKRGLDVVVELAPGGIRRNRNHLKRFLHQPRRTMAIVSPAAINAAFEPEERDAFVAINHHRLLPVTSNALHSVTPDDPLSLLQESTLLAALPALVAAQPRRIFVIGGEHRLRDGEAGSHFGIRSPHFTARGAGDFVTDGNDAQARANFDLALQHNATVTDRDLAFQVAAVATLHGSDAPPVFNVAPDSRLQSLPKITLDDFFAMVG
jgi:tetratricopeptide (TPR) repeat protein